MGAEERRARNGAPRRARVDRLAGRWYRVGGGMSVWYPPAALVLAVFVLGGPRRLPWVVLARTVAAVWLVGPPVPA